MPDDVKTRKRMVVEEVAPSVENPQTPLESIEQPVEKPVEETKEVIPAISQPEPQPEKPPVEPDETVTPQIKSGGGPNPLIIIIPGILLLGALLGGIVFYQRGISGGSTAPTPTPVSEITPAPSSTAPAQVDLTKYPINVMNGSGTAGQAGVVKDLLVAAGFSVSATGNASSYDFTKTVIKAKVEVPTAFLTQLSNALSKSYVLDTNQPLATSSADEVEVIVGSTKVQ